MQKVPKELSIDSMQYVSIFFHSTEIKHNISCTLSKEMDHFYLIRTNTHDGRQTLQLMFYNYGISK